MRKMLLLIVFPACISFSIAYSQKRYGYTVLQMRCGKQDPHRNRIYFSPVIELNTLNFARYTDGVDPAFPKYSVRYYNYAIAKWFEIYLMEKYQVAVNDPEKYERNATSMVFDNYSSGNCDDDKTEPGCFFTDKEKLIQHRNKAISESRSSQHKDAICEVISL